MCDLKLLYFEVLCMQVLYWIEETYQEDGEYVKNAVRSEVITRNGEDIENLSNSQSCRKLSSDHDGGVDFDYQISSS